MNNHKKYNIAFFGTPELCIPILEELKKNNFTPNLIVTNPDKKVGRKHTLTQTPVSLWANDNQIEIFTPEKITLEFISDIKKNLWDLFIVVAYGKILPQTLIDAPEFGTLNIHYSLLPRWRGASPVESAILSGDLTSGVCVQQMVYALDAGPILGETKVSLSGDEFHEELKTIFSEIGGEMLCEILPRIFEKNIESVPQNESHVTICTKTKKTDGLVSLLDNSPISLWRKYRAYHGWPGIYYIQDEKRININEAEFDEEEKIFTITRETREGEKERLVHKEIK